MVHGDEAGLKVRSFPLGGTQLGLQSGDVRLLARANGGKRGVGGGAQGAAPRGAPIAAGRSLHRRAGAAACERPCATCSEHIARCMGGAGARVGGAPRPSRVERRLAVAQPEGDGGPAGFGDAAVVPAGGSGGAGFVAEVRGHPPGAPLADLVQQTPWSRGATVGASGGIPPALATMRTATAASHAVDQALQRPGGTDAAAAAASGQWPCVVRLGSSHPGGIAEPRGMMTNGGSICLSVLE
mmetsp:Transcript_8749/g.26185  ORF Transcript_8749/g.26185 Transcript_8749/m.26185 type:complete len:241 (-) Transcript_8749:266-988(-)